MLSHFLTWGLSEREKRRASEIDRAVFVALEPFGRIERPTWRGLSIGGSRLIELAANDQAIIAISSNEFLELPTIDIAMRIQSAFRLSIAGRVKSAAAV